MQTRQVSVCWTFLPLKFFLYHYYLVYVTDCHCRKIHIIKRCGSCVHSGNNGGLREFWSLFKDKTKGYDHWTEDHSGPQKSPAFLWTMIDVLPPMKACIFTIFSKWCICRHHEAMAFEKAVFVDDYNGSFKLSDK